jgi:hypothetical protein
MVHTTTMTCDRCGKTQTISAGSGSPTWWRLRLHVDRDGRQSASPYTSPYLEVEWCDECASAKGLIGARPKPEPDETPPTASEQLEELIREIACDEIQDATGA